MPPRSIDPPADANDDEITGLEIRYSEASSWRYPTSWFDELHWGIILRGWDREIAPHHYDAFVGPSRTCEQFRLELVRFFESLHIQEFVIDVVPM